LNAATSTRIGTNGVVVRGLPHHSRPEGNIMKTKVCSTLVLGMIGSMLAACGGSTSDSTGASAKLQPRIKTAACVAWVSGGTYTAGEVVTYNGANYTALVNQTD